MKSPDQYEEDALLVHLDQQIRKSFPPNTATAYVARFSPHVVTKIRRELAKAGWNVEEQGQDWHLSPVEGGNVEGSTHVSSPEQYELEALRNEIDQELRNNFPTNEVRVRVGHLSPHVLVTVRQELAAAGWKLEEETREAQVTSHGKGKVYGLHGRLIWKISRGG